MRIFENCRELLEKLLLHIKCSYSFARAACA